MRVISFFSGAGGMDLGFTLAGHDVVWANDFDNYAVQTYNENIGRYLGHESVFGDITEILNISNEEIDELIPDGDIVIGGFPCQGFSIANVNRNMEDDERNFLYLELLRIITIKQPSFFILENVKGLENIEGGEVLNMIIEDLEGAGYTVCYDVLNAYNFGVPQNRERVIIVGIRNDLRNIYSIPQQAAPTGKPKKTLFVQPTHSRDSQIEEDITCWQKVNELYTRWINGDLDRTRNYLRNEENIIFRVQTLRDAIGDLPEDFQPDNPEISNHTGTLCKVNINNRVGNRATDWNRYAPTIMGRGSGTGGPLIIPHPLQHRRLSVREVARIQTFPDNFRFLGSNSACYRQIGNAVPVLMAYNIAKMLPLE
ncbi:MAG: DNA cytosine methyltransferase [Clostridium sp.]|uniref:DNA cytosine methyltransferase n=1 Tax=Clostridium sp. TaxID=1506 RepID=UPI002913DD8C|nr:DNA cytosine methyltransferase [Clostridium sp.]MDU4938229.1 DNA cytosine methyltransferase [Clostridium sp.]